MGKLVRFEKRRPDDKAQAPRAGEAQIVMFTGVRYERNGAPEPGKPPASAGPKRKRG